MGKMTHPIQLSIMRQYNIRRAQCEICTETRALDGVEGVEKGHGILSLVECGGEKTAVVTLWVAAFFVVCARGACFGVIDLLDCVEETLGIYVRGLCKLQWGDNNVN
jgi:hypothetical protein